MATPDQASLPPFFTLTKGQTVRFTAIDATTGALVSGVTISGMRLSVDSEDSASSVPPPPNQAIPFMPGKGG